MNCGAEVSELITLLGRYTTNVSQIERARELAKTPTLNWNGFLAACFKQKIAGLVYLTAHVNAVEIPGRIWQVLRLYYAANAVRNRVMHEELDRLLHGLTRHDIDARPLKGAVLGRLIYVDGGSRFQNDIDLFVRRTQAGRIPDAMRELGYEHGAYKRSTREVRPYSREELVLWRIKMFNLPPFTKTLDDPFVEAMHVDFTYGLSFGLKEDVSELVMNDRGDIGGLRTLNPVDFLIHLCCHLHKEATNEAWEDIGQDINLIKFCDVREYIIQQRNAISVDKLRDRVRQLGVEEAMIFSLSGVLSVYRDHEVRSLLNELGYAPVATAQRQIYRQGAELVAVREVAFSESFSTL